MDDYSTGMIVGALIAWSSFGVGWYLVSLHRRWKALPDIRQESIVDIGIDGRLFPVFEGLVEISHDRYDLEFLMERAFSSDLMHVGITYDDGTTRQGVFTYEGLGKIVVLPSTE